MLKKNDVINGTHHTAVGVLVCACVVVAEDGQQPPATQSMNTSRQMLRQCTSYLLGLSFLDVSRCRRTLSEPHHRAQGTFRFRPWNVGAALGVLSGFWCKAGSYARSPRCPLGLLCHCYLGCLGSISYAEIPSEFRSSFCFRGAFHPSQEGVSSLLQNSKTKLHVCGVVRQQQ